MLVSAVNNMMSGLWSGPFVYAFDNAHTLQNFALEVFAGYESVALAELLPMVIAGQLSRSHPCQ